MLFFFNSPLTILDFGSYIHLTRVLFENLNIRSIIQATLQIYGTTVFIIAGTWPNSCPCVEPHESSPYSHI